MMRVNIDNNKDFVSICIPFFNRFYYFERVLNSIHKYTDTPFELVVHDDGSTDGSTDELYKVKDKISTLIINQGKSVGLAESINRCVEIASSEYIVFINADVVFNRTYAKNVTDILNKEYVGFVGLTDPKRTLEEHINSNGTIFSLAPGIGSGCAFAFRKSLWSIIGGFDSDVRSGCADSPFMYKSWSNGYFRAVVSGEQIATNLSLVEKRNSDSTIGKNKTDCNFPKIFNDDYNIRCRKRFDYVESRFKNLELNPDNEGNIVTDMKYWSNYSLNVIPEWGKLKDINFDAQCEKSVNSFYRWKEIVTADIEG